jgi:hypothetical protein
MVIASLDLRIGTPPAMPLQMIDELNGLKVKFNFLAGYGKMQQNGEKASFRGLKPVESTQFTSALKHRPP